MSVVMLLIIKNVLFYVQDPPDFGWPDEGPKEKRSRITFHAECRALLSKVVKFPKTFVTHVWHSTVGCGLKALRVSVLPVRPSQAGGLARHISSFSIWRTVSFSRLSFQSYKF